MAKAQAAPGGLEIRLLGEFEVVANGRATPLPASKKSRALLGFLVASAGHTAASSSSASPSGRGAAHLREKLCELLWDTPDDPRAALRWSLTKIRPILDQGGVTRLVADRERVAFEPIRVAVDLDDVVRETQGDIGQVPLEVLRRAAARFRGEFLAGLDLASCYRYHAWCIGQREAARTLRLSILGALAERLVEQPEEALQFARERVAIDPLAEAGHVALIRLLGILGRARDALDQYETCRRMLQNELGNRPSFALEAARMSLVNPAPGASPEKPIPEASPPRAPAHTGPTIAEHGSAPSLLPLAGRRRERQILANSLGSAGASPRGLLIVGDPGIGKTRLLEELALMVRERGGTVLTGRAFEAEMIRPYGAFIDALRSVPLPGLTQTMRADLAGLLPEIASTPNPIAIDKTRLFDAVAGLLSSMGSPSAPAALLLDDLQWFDEASAALLHFVSRSSKHTIVAVAARAGELADNPAALRVVRSLAREHRLEEIRLAPLTSDETAQLSASVASGVDAARVFSESDGSPLFAIEVARALSAGGSAASEGLMQLIAGRLEGLDERAARALDWAAALGRSFQADLLQRVATEAPADLLSALDELERRSIIRSTSLQGAGIGAAGAVGAGIGAVGAGIGAAGVGIGYDFAHDLVRQAAYRRISEPRRRLIHLQIARALSALDDPSGALAGDLAHHAALGGDDELCVRACTVAAERCLGLFANAEAIELSERGLSRIAALPHEIRIPHQVRLLRIRVLSRMWRGKKDELESQLSRAILEAQSSGLGASVALGVHTLSDLNWGAGNFTSAEANSLRLIDASRATDPETAARSLCHAGRCLAQLEQHMAVAWGLLDEAEKRASASNLDLPGIQLGLGIVRHHLGEDDEAQVLLARARRLSADVTDHFVEWESLSRLAMIAIERGAADEALAYSAELAPLAAKLGEGSEAPVTAALDALARLLLGEPDAASRVEAAIAELRAVDSKAHLAYVLTSVGFYELEHRRLEPASRRAVEALAAAQAVGRRSEVARVRALLACLALENGDRSGAVNHIHQLENDLAKPLGVSAGALARVKEVASRLGVSIPTPAPTRAPPPFQQAPVIT